MDIREIKSVIEALLFTWGDPLDIKDISKIINISERDVSFIIKDMIDEFDYNRRGIQIIKVGNSYQLSTRVEHYEWIKKLNPTNDKKNLSIAALETLSIIAYKQPIIKSDIEHIRGVKSDKVIETLIQRNLVRELGRLEKPGKPIIYGTTNEFLRAFGLENLDDLPFIQNLEEITEIKTQET
ncbi:SMC-Scp complex subunit ScpB [Tissierella creatinophila]|uniref:Segregation and condensation protein B n=1 Tax=Tissierella creatinophila DSM 6911 TaxID=1123403 RepID=A0A1U7M9D5_TISCR|nr:SMC-Scp complex subunit ScpB [Tissierella creatinophila]OLS03954.1 segregation and condensation protein B [Tissierella creatinophila DSM 6911]